MEQVEVDVLFVGAGPASLAGAYHLAGLLKKNNLSNISVAVIEKSKEPGDHILSGAVMDPCGLKELIPDFIERDAPLDSPVRQDRMMFLTSGSNFTLPFVPPSLNNHGNYIVSLDRLCVWLAGEAEKSGVDIFFQTPGAELIYEGNRVAGVKTASAGLNKSGAKKSNYQPGYEIRAKITILGEGAFGSLTQSLIQKLDLMKGKNPQTFSAGVKEIWEVPAENHKEGSVIHTLGWPLSSDTFGGGWIYHMRNNLVSIGFVVGLDYKNPDLDLQEELQKYKTHPMISKMLDGGKLLAYGAKAIAEGGYFSMPRLYGDGFMLIGESGGFLNSARLKGIHLAVKSGMLAAETAFEALRKNDFSSVSLSGYENKFKSGWAFRELWKVRNFHQGFKHGLWAGMANYALQWLTGGRGLFARYPSSPDWPSLAKGVRPLEKTRGLTPLGIPKMSDLYLSGVYHEEDQPSHIVITEPDICSNQCMHEYGNPCRNFCPAGVFEIVDNQLKLSPSNCIHCKTCAIKDPYNIVLWKVPEGGGGPRYKMM